VHGSGWDGISIATNTTFGAPTVTLPARRSPPDGLGEVDREC